MGNLTEQSFVKRNNGILNLKVLIEKLQKSLLHAKSWGPRNISFGSSKDTVPGDVKEGHFAVIASADEEERRFVVPLAYLDRPSFQILLERAGEEYGFNHEGALVVPCRPSELEAMLTQRESDLGWIYSGKLLNLIQF